MVEKKPKVCCVIPPSIFLLDERVFPSLGILKVAASLEAAGHPVEVLDLSGIKNYEEVASAHARSTDAEVFAITTTTPQMPATHRIAQALRGVGGKKLIIGGPHPTLINAALRREKKLGIVRGRAQIAMDQLVASYDVVVAGDGELAIFDALKGERGVVDADDPKGEMWLTNSRYETTPMPARHLIDLDSYHYTIDGAQATSIIGQLGCPFKCIAPYTKIISCEGKNKKAEDVRAGDKLLAIDENTKELVSTTVTKLFVHDAEDLYRITFEDGKKIDATSEHPFYVREKWIEVRDLRPGDEVFDIDWKEAQRARMRLGNPVKNEQTKEKISKTVKRCFELGTLTADHLKKSSPKREKVNEGLRKYWSSEESDDSKRRISERMSRDNPMFDPVIASKAASTMRARVEAGECSYFMQTQEYWDSLKKPFNKQEKAFDSLLRAEFGDRYKFSGDGSFRIGFYAPDFVDEPGKKIIEYNGCWWHGCPTCFPEKETGRKRDADRIVKFEAAGYKVHVVWSHEMSDEISVMSRLRQFTHNGARIKSIKLLGKSTVYNFECFPHHNFFAEYLLTHNCGFCGGRESNMLRRIRNRSTDSILTELESVHRTYGHTGFMFYDDELNVSKSMVELMDGIAALQGRLGTEFRLRGFVKAELFTEKQAQAMVRAGFRWLLTGFESGSPRILENIAKQATREDNTRCFEIARNAGLKVKALMSIGHPGESEETVLDTERWLMEVRPDDFDVTIITTYPGTPYYDHAVETSPGIWTYTYEKTGDRLHAYQLDYNTTADYYKGDPEGGYKAYVYTDFLSSDDLVRLRGEVESRVRGTLQIPFNPGMAATNYEHSMGQMGPLPPNILRSSSPLKKREVVRLNVL